MSYQTVDGPLARALLLPDPVGALVTDIDAGGPAQRAGIRPGDLITAVEGRAIQSAGDLDHELARRKPREVVRFVVRRGLCLRTPVTLAVSSTASPTATATPSSPAPPPPSAQKAPPACASSTPKAAAPASTPSTPRAPPPTCCAPATSSSRSTTPSSTAPPTRPAVSHREAAPEPSRTADTPRCCACGERGRSFMSASI